MHAGGLRRPRHGYGAHEKCFYRFLDRRPRARTMEAAAENRREMRVQFFTKQKQSVAQRRACWRSRRGRFTVTDTPIAIPLTVRRSQLSQMINHLLGLGMDGAKFGIMRAPCGIRARLVADCTVEITCAQPLCGPASTPACSLQCADPPRPFDFLIDGEFLRVSLEKYVEHAGLSLARPLRAPRSGLLFHAGTTAVD